MVCYVLITAARNEDRYIEKTILSVLSQKILPKRWMIVSDGSTDQTEEIVLTYARHFPFINLMRKPPSTRRNFGSKVHALNLAITALLNTDYDFIGVLDADIGLGTDYYATILKQFEKNPNLGIAGGIRLDRVNNTFRQIRCAANSVGGPIQLFRRECFEQIGKFLPLPYGGEDSVAEISARMHGWEVRTFPSIKVYHFRPTGTADDSAYRAAFNVGIRLYVIGYHPLFFLIRCIYRSTDRPLFVSGPLMLAGYAWAWANHFRQPVPGAVKSFLRQEQMLRVKALLRRNSTSKKNKNPVLLPGDER